MQTMYRKRTQRNRYELSNGECYVGFHFGKRSLYFKKQGSRPCGIRKLRDVNGIETIDCDVLA